MKRFLFKITAFALFSAILYSVLLYSLGTFAPSFIASSLSYQLGAPGHTLSRVREARGTDEVDILFLGSSHAYRGFDPRIFRQHGYRTFNLGSTSQTPLQALVLLKRYVDRLHPKLVVLEVFPEVMQFEGTESAVDLLSNDTIDLLSIDMAIKIGTPKVYNTLIFSAIKEALGEQGSFEEPAVKGTDRYIQGGYVERDLSYYQSTNLPYETWRPSEEQLAYVREIKKRLGERQIRLLLVYAPIAASNFERHTNNDEFDLEMSGIGDYINFNNTLQLDEASCFYDSHHLNQIGVELFNESLIEVLSAKYPALPRSARGPE